MSAHASARVDDGRSVVVVVEDDPAVRAALRPALVAAGFEVVDGPATCAPDLVLLDPGSLDVDGTGFSAHLRELLPGSVVVLTDRRAHAAPPPPERLPMMLDRLRAGRRRRR
ncbi:hypothetical protein [Amnibacterium endophyticum]|uniref:Response regulatory domain-containing protein n=1 Tax=Amnibacterium endophyticum TaxID=2109337 RepID=A0ABW4LC18_9MICO